MTGRAGGRDDTQQRTQRGSHAGLVVAVIPAYNEERFIGSVVIKACKYADAVIVVDDGSTDATVEIVRLAGATVIEHPQNAGKGAAVSTGWPKHA